MDCADCARTLEKGVGRLDGVEEVQVDFTTEIMHGRGNVSLDVIAAKVDHLGYGIATKGEASKVALPDARGIKGFFRFLVSQPHSAVALGAAAVLLAAFILSLVSSSPQIIRGVDSLFLVITAIVTYPLAKKGLRSLFQARRVTIDLLMTIAVLGAIIIGATGEAVTVALLFTLGEALEGYSAERSRESLRSLLALQPTEATVMRPHYESHNGEVRSGEYLNHEGHAPAREDEGHVHYHRRTVPVEDVGIGEIVIVRPGERIPVDGRISQGTSSINQAPVTGESVPVERSVDDDVFAGTINGEGTLEIDVTRLASDSTISQIVRLVEQAQAQRSPAENFIDQFAAWYTPAVVGMAIAMLLVATLLFGQPLLETEQGHGWLYRALALLIIACPCALVISIPVTVVSSLTRLVQLGVLVKGGARLNELSQAKVFAFDKTGTLTRGQPVITGMQTMECGHEADLGGECPSCDEMLALASSVESGSEHPLAHAVLREARHRQVMNQYPLASSITADKGGGISGRLNGEIISVGRRDLFNTEPSRNDVAKLMIALGDGKKSTMIVTRDDNVLGGICVEDTPREESSDALNRLREMDPDVYIVMLTGDHSKPAETLASLIGGIDEVHSELRPADKMGVVKDLREKYGRVAMIGDGINDAPALASADIGIAMGGSGTAQAMETADVVLMQDNLTLLTSAVRIGRKTRQVLRQNIALSLALKGVVLALVIPGLATLWMAVFADVGATLLVTLNGMRMLRESAD